MSAARQPPTDPSYGSMLTSRMPGSAERDGPVRVMVVDDSVVIRGLVSRWIGQAPGFEVVAAAPDGRVALELADETAPDIVLLDLDMPELDGLATLPLLLARRPGLSVIIVSTLTQRDAVMSLRCLTLGAVDYLPKPSTQHEAASSHDFRRELITRLEGFSSLHRRSLAAPRTAPRFLPAWERPTEAVPPMLRAASPRPRCVLIGASTGGPRAVTQVLKGLGHVSERVPILLVQHMPPVFTTVFAEQVASETGIAVREGRDGERLDPGRVYVAPGGRHMGLSMVGDEIAIRLDDGAPVRHCRPAVDILFRDAARLFGASTLGIVLTGMGMDGTDGARAVVEAGGTVIAQDEATSTIWGMPGSVAKAGLANSVLPLNAIASAVDSAFHRRGG